MVRPLLKRHGPGRVWRVGLAELGFPPTWIHTLSETSRLQAALN